MSLVWRIEIDDNARKDLKKLGSVAEQRILSFLRKKLGSVDPRSIGESLKGSKLGNLWRYRVGDYRVLAVIEDDILRVLVVGIGHRREVYRK